MIKGKDYNEFIQTNKKIKNDKSKKLIDKVYFLGYIDGFYDEHEYKRFIPDDDDCIGLYVKGYDEGKTNREIDSGKVIFPKKVWLLKLALYDYSNGFRDRKLSKSAEEYYNLHYDDLIKYGVIDNETLSDMIKKSNIRF